MCLPMLSELQQAYDCSRRWLLYAEKHGRPPMHVAACMSETADCIAFVLLMQSAMRPAMDMPDKVRLPTDTGRSGRCYSHT